MSKEILSIFNTFLMSAGWSPRIAIVGLYSVGKTLFLKSFFNANDQNSIFPLHLTKYEQYFLECIECPTDIHLEALIACLKDISGVIFICDSLDRSTFKIVSKILSEISFTQIILFWTKCTEFQTIQNSYTEISLDLRNEEHLARARPILCQFLNSILSNV